MAKCYFFNIQLLPIDRTSKESGGFVEAEGYKKLFDSLRKVTEEKRENKNLHEYGLSIKRTEFFLVTTKVAEEENYIRLTFRKFDKVRAVTEFYTEEEMFSVPTGKSGVNKSWNFTAIFDPKSHILAVEDNTQKLPAISTIEELIFEILDPIAGSTFPNYQLSCNVLKQRDKLESVTSANKFRSVEVSLTYSNPADTEDELEGLIDEENREHGVERLVVSQRAAKGGIINGLPKYSKALLNLASRYGDAAVTYFDEKQQAWKKFKFSQWPVNISIRKNKDNKAHRLNIFSKIREANQSAIND